MKWIIFFGSPDFFDKKYAALVNNNAAIEGKKAKLDNGKTDRIVAKTAIIMAKIVNNLFI